MPVGRGVLFPKDLVEDCLTLSLVGALGGKQPPDRPHAGRITWRSASGDERASVGYILDAHANPPFLQLEYRANGEPITLTIPLLTTPMRFGGQRWWFACPRCARLCTRLHMPPSGKRFACRTCCGLGYRSQRESNARVRALLQTPGYLESLGDRIEGMSLPELCLAFRVIAAHDRQQQRDSRHEGRRRRRSAGS